MINWLMMIVTCCVLSSQLTSKLINTSRPQFHLLCAQSFPGYVTKRVFSFVFIICYHMFWFICECLLLVIC